LAIWRESFFLAVEGSALDADASSGHLAHMALPWRTIDRAVTAAGALELRRRGPSDVLLTIDGRILMNSHADRSETGLARLACRDLGTTASATVLIGGLGLGCTLRAALALLPKTARVIVAEIDPLIVRWSREHLADLYGRALDDPRLDLRIEDVTQTVARAAQGAAHTHFHAILFDLYEGPSPKAQEHDHPLYGRATLKLVRAALHPGGVFAVWSEQPSRAFEARLRGAGFVVELKRPGHGALRHAVYVART